MDRLKWSPVIGVALLTVAALESVRAAEPTARSFQGPYVDVRTYLPEGYVTDGSVDYRPHLQRCLDENACVYFPGSNDPQNPMIYGSTAGLKTSPSAMLRFGPNAILRRLPSFDDLLRLGPGAHLIGAVIDGNKYGHWPLLQGREIQPYAFVTGAAVVLGGQNVIEDCLVYNNAGIAFGAWGVSDNKIYRSRAENCGFLEAMGEYFWSGEHASADGFLFCGGSRNNLVRDCEAYDCTRWGFVLTEGTRNNTFVDCRGGDLHFLCFGFIDVEGDEYANSLIRCRSSNSNITVMGSQNDLWGCVASQIDAQNASFPRIIGCTTTGGPILVGGTLESLEQNRMPGAMVRDNRVFLSRPYSGGGIRVACSDGQAIVAHNTVYAYQRGEHRAQGLRLHNVAVNDGNQVVYGQWDTEIRQFDPPSYVRAYVDQAFLQQRQREIAQKRLEEYLPKLGFEGPPAYQQVFLGEYPFRWDPEDVGIEQKWYRTAQRPSDLIRKPIGRHWDLGKVFGPSPVGWHFLTFDLPTEQAAGPVFLHFGAVDGFATVYLNGRLVGTHDGDNPTGWIEPFHFDVTGLVRAGKNDLSLRITASMLLAGPFRAISVVAP